MFCLLAEYYLREETIGWVIVFFLLFFLFTKGFLKIISLKPLVYLGSISYSLYLTHQIIGYILINQLRKSGIENAWILLSTAILWSIILAGCIRHFIEKPGQQLIRNYYHHIFRSTKNQT
jgi:peptidoglycan/LPS O-acetylase OafA/YrhL